MTQTTKQRLIEAAKAKLIEVAKREADWHQPYDDGTVAFEGVVPLAEIVDAILAELRVPTEEMRQAAYQATKFERDQFAVQGTAFTAMIDHIRSQR